MPLRGLSVAALPRRAAALPFGVACIDAALPGGGLALGGLHEIAGGGPDAEHGAAAALFAAGILARIPGPVLWVLEQRDLFAPGLAGAGLHPDRVVYAQAGRQEAMLVMEEGLRHRGLAGVAAEISGRITLSASRRLQLAAEATRGDCPAAAASPAGGGGAGRGGGGGDAVADRGAAVGPADPRGARMCRGLGGCAGGSTCCGAGADGLDRGSWRRAMRRVISVWLPHWPTDRIRRTCGVGAAA